MIKKFLIRKVNKLEIRKKILNQRKKNFFHKFDNSKIYNFLKRYKKNKIGGYFPINYEFDCLEILKKLSNQKFQISLPIMKKNNQMDFYSWDFNQPLIVNNYGIPEPVSSKITYPDIFLIPIVGFDKNLYRIGYGGGYYDRYILRMKKIKNIITIGLSFSFQKIDKVPINKFDQKLDTIITERNIFK